MHRLMKGLIVSAAVFAALFALAVPAMADYISDVQANDTTGNLVELNYVAIGPPFFQGNNSWPIVTALLSTPGTMDGHTYTSYAFYVNDTTGGMDVFSPSSTLSSLGYTPHVGDALDIKGTYEPFDGFPEVSVITKAALQSTGNAYTPPVTGVNLAYVVSDFAHNSQTVTSGTVTTTIGPNDLTAQFVTLSNVWLTNGGTSALQTSFGTGNSTGTTILNDSSGGSCSFFYWPTSYSAEFTGIYGNPPVYGQSISYGPSSLYNMTGFFDVFSGTPEFVPFIVNPVSPTPEPGTLALFATGTAVAAVTYIGRKRRKSTARAQHRPRATVGADAWLESSAETNAQRRTCIELTRASHLDIFCSVLSAKRGRKVKRGKD